MENVSDDALSPNHQVALVIHQLRLRNELPDIPPLLRAAWPFPELNAHDAFWLERKRKESEVDWPWFRNAISFLKGEGVPQSSFERVKTAFLEQVDKEINGCRGVSGEQLSDEHKRLIGGFGGMRGNVSGSVESVWDKKDPSEWREQK